MKPKNRRLCLAALLLTVATALLLLSFPARVSYEGVGAETAFASTTSATSAIAAATTTDSVNIPQGLPPILSDIRWCESRGDQSARGYNYLTEVVTLADGSTTTQKVLWSTDVGEFQINDYYHAETARRLGFDIYTAEGNRAYAMVLYNTNGTRDWNPSKPCWSDIEAWRARQKSYY